VSDVLRIQEIVDRHKKLEKADRNLTFTSNAQSDVVSALRLLNLNGLAELVEDLVDRPTQEDYQDLQSQIEGLEEENTSLSELEGIVDDQTEELRELRERVTELEAQVAGFSNRQNNSATFRVDLFIEGDPLDNFTIESLRSELRGSIFRDAYPDGRPLPYQEQDTVEVWGWKRIAYYVVEDGELKFLWYKARELPDSDDSE
jgi:polyhydroxyalkanoate synthesis regulator phasin